MGIPTDWYNAMAFIPLPNGMRVALEGLLSGEPVANIFHVTSATPPSPTDLSNVASIFQSWWGVNMSPFISTAFTLPTITVTDVSVANGQQFIDSGLTLAGAVANAALPSNVALVISWRTIFTGRSFRGRTYVAGLPENSVAGTQEFAPGIATDGLNAGNALLTLLTAGGYSLVVASYRSLGAPRVTGVATPVTTVQCNVGIDTQRKRIKQP